MSYDDIEVRGEIVKQLDNSIIFQDEEGRRVQLPREEIAIVQEVNGVTVTLPQGLARAKGLA